MSNIKDIRKTEMEEIIDFYHHIQEYGHIFYGKTEDLDPAFKKIMEGIDEIRQIQNEYWSY
jgi:hypothetical protein